jgi:predicted ABC-type exoprotein transport system permease subunit
VLTSYWYSKTYDEYIKDPDTQFLLCLEAYMDKAAKNEGLTSYAGEPFLVSALHLKKPLREHSSANRNYHKIMDAVLEGIVTAQKRESSKLYSRWMMSFT